VPPYAYRWFIEGEVAAAKGQHDEAAVAFEAATTGSADDVVLMTRLAEEYGRSGASRRADRTLALARRRYPGAARIDLAEGRIHQARNQAGQALCSFAHASRLAPTWHEPVIAMAEALRAQGHRERANALLLEYGENAPEGGAAAARRALIEAARHDVDTQALERGLDLEPGSSPAARAWAAGQLLLDAGRPALAARILEDALITPENIALWLRALVESGDRSKASGFLASGSGERFGTLEERADLLLELGDADRAMKLLDAADGTSPRVEYLKGRALLARGSCAEAAMLLASIPLGAASFEASRLALADCALSRDREGAAAEALSLVPHGSLPLREKLADIYLNMGELHAALHLFDPREMPERAALASIYESAGRLEEASAYYATTNVGASDPPRLRARVSAEWLASRGQYLHAVVILERWTAIAPEDLHARVRLVELLLMVDRVKAARIGRDALEVVGDPVLRSRLLRLLAEAVAVQP
jgi:thioredoxin-like negative regulator of GroEL